MMLAVLLLFTYIHAFVDCLKDLFSFPLVFHYLWLLSTQKSNECLYILINQIKHVS